jgi:hypothetical protein
LQLSKLTGTQNKEQRTQLLRRTDSERKKSRIMRATFQNITNRVHLKPPTLSSSTSKRLLSLPVPLSKKKKEDCEQQLKLEEEEENIFPFAHNYGN